MNKNNQLINRIFLIALPVILGIFVIVACFAIFKPFAIRKLSQLPKATIDDCLNKDESTYYCLIYDPNDPDNEIIKGVVTEYYTAQKANKELKPIYVIDYSKAAADVVQSVLEKVESADDVPYMFIVSSGKVSTKYDTSSKICNALNAAMGK